MAYSILLTSLCASSKDEPIRYYGIKDGNRYYYCDAVLTVEACAKYALSKYKIDEIITLGSRLTFDEGDDGRIIELREGKTFYAADINELSTYSLFRYRIAQYIDEVRIEQQDLAELLNPKEQEKVTKFIKQFFKKYSAEYGIAKYNRLFDALARDEKLYSCFRSELIKKIPQVKYDSARFMSWIKNYLYYEFKSSGKLEILPDNEDIKCRFIPTSIMDDGKLPIDNIIQLVSSITSGHDEIELYVALHSDDPTDNYVLINVLDIVKSMPGSNVELRKIFTSAGRGDSFVGDVSDDTESYGISELVAATRTFLQYGKVDMIVDYWKRYGSKNERVEQMIYAMRHIDIGISLCTISEIEDGIAKLRHLFSTEREGWEDDYYCNLFAIIGSGIKRDYGPLLEKDTTEFIDLVKWAYRKKFYQQTLTLIESKAPMEFVNRGFFYYCDDVLKRDDVIRKFAEIRSEKRPHELYMFEKIEHYFVKLHERRKTDRSNLKADIQRVYAKYRISTLDAEGPDEVRAYTCCDDRQALENLLYAYYHLGEVRNRTNHADETDVESAIVIDPRDMSARLNLICESIEYFLLCYDKVAQLTEGKHPEVVKVLSAEVKAKCNELKKQNDGVEPKAATKAKKTSKSPAKKASARKKTTE
ncbi:MAG: hypothetical protein IKE53_00015 [Clostridiales bacterium]|nr:hypothetical protein [Clostridiales bacterium]